MALNATALAFAQDLRFRGIIESATHYGVAGSPGGGPYFQLWLIVEGGRIARASYETHGCPSSMAVGGGLCRLIERRELSKAQTLTREDLVALIGPLPEGKEFCYELAITALISAKEKK
jgi:nitrogen fixation NifU-like protein